MGKEVQAKEGGVDLAHWQKVWKKACKLDGEFVDGFFKVFDEADNEWVDFREYAIWAALVGRKPVRRKISYCYRVFDRNGNGVLEEEELNLLCEAVYRTLKRVKFNKPGEVNTEGHESFALSSKEVKEAHKVAKHILEECTDDDADVAGASYKNIQAKWDSNKHLKEVKKVLECFDHISEALPSSGETEGPYSKKYSSKKDKKDKKGKKRGKKGGATDDSTADASADDDKKGKKGSKKGKKASKKDKKAKGKAKKGKSKKGESADESADAADESKKGKDKKASKKDKKAKGQAKKGKSADESADAADDSKKGKSKKGKDKKASKKDKKASKKDKKAKGKKKSKK